MPKRRVARVRSTKPVNEEEVPEVVKEIIEDVEVGDVCPTGIMEAVESSGFRLFKVCLDWDLQVIDEALDISQGEIDRFKGSVLLMPYSHLIHKRIVDAGYGAWCYQSIMEEISKMGTHIKSVAEYCGGIGRTATIIQNVLEPDSHFIVERDMVLVKQLKFAFPNAEVMHGDYTEVMKRNVILSCIDNNSFTVHKFLEPKYELKESIRDIVLNSQYTLITDTAKSRLHLNKERYQNLMGGSIESERDYLELFSKTMYEEAGASIVHVTSHPRASYILFQKNVIPGVFDITSAPEEAKEYFQLAAGERELRVTEEIKVEKEVEEIAEEPEGFDEPEEEENVETADEGGEEDDTEITKLKRNLRDEPDALPDIPDIEDEDIFDKGGELKVAIVMAGGGAAGKSTASKAFAVGEPDELNKPGAWYDRNDNRNITGVNVTVYDNYALTGNHQSGTDSNQAPDLVRLATWRALGHKDIVIIDGMVSSPQWVSTLNNWPGKVPLHVLLVHFDLTAETLLDRLAYRREVDKESIRDDMYPKCAGLVRRAEILVEHFVKDCERPMTKLVVDMFMSPEDIVEAMDDMLTHIYNKYDLEYDSMRS